MLSLGCVGIEPILAAMSGSAAQATMACKGGAMSANAAGPAPGSISASEQTRAGTHYDCGCQSCTAAVVVVPDAPTVRVAPAQARSAVVVQLIGIATRPLIPPPQRTL